MIRGEIGNALDISVKRSYIIRYGNECFKIEAMLSVCLYQRFLTFKISFDRDALITKSPLSQFLTMYDELL